MSDSGVLLRLQLRPSWRLAGLVFGAHILAAVGSRLAKRRSPYSAVFQALLARSGEKVSWTPVTDAEIREEDDPATLDKLWQEQPAFGKQSQQPQVSVIHFHGRAAS